MDLVKIAWRQFAPFTESELGMLRVARSGELLWCSGHSEYWHPSNDPENGASWGPDRAVRADLIRWLIRDPDAAEYISPHGLRIAGARIEGKLDLSHMMLRWPLGFLRCLMRSGLTLFFARAMNLDFAGSSIWSVDATRLITQGSLLLGVASHVRGEVNLEDAQIDGDFDCAGGCFQNPDGSAIKAVGSKVNGSVMFGVHRPPGGGRGESFRSSGKVNLTGAQIGGDLDCEGGTFCAPATSQALAAKAARVSGSVLLRAHKWPNGECDCFSAQGEVTLEDAQIGATLDCSGGRFVNPGGVSLNLNGGKVEGNLFLTDGFQSQGEVNLVGARIGSFLECSGGRFINLPSKDPNAAKRNCSALVASEATIGGSVHMGTDDEGRGFEARGPVELRGAQVAGHLYCGGGRFLDGDTALAIDGATIRGDVNLGNDANMQPFLACGTVSLVGAAIAGQFDCSGGRFIRNGGTTIAASLARIGGHASFGEGFSTDGMVNFDYAEIAGLLSFESAEFVGSAEYGLRAQAASIRGDFVWRPGPSETKADRGSIFGRLRTWTVVAIRRLLRRLPRDGSIRYTLDLGHTSVGRLKDDAAKWPTQGNLKIGGFVYGTFHLDSLIDAGKRLEWLRRQGSGYGPQPYLQLAKVLRAAGREEDAVKVLIANEKALRASGNLSWFSWIWKWILQITIGYGYRPLRALWFVLFFVVLGSFLFDWGYQAGVITPTEREAFDLFKTKDPKTKDPSFAFYGGFSPVIYSLGTFVPLVDLYQGRQWRPNADVNPRYLVKPLAILEPLPLFDRLPKPKPLKFNDNFGSQLRRYLWFHILMGWFFTTLLLAGLTGLVRTKE